MKVILNRDEFLKIRRSFMTREDYALDLQDLYEKYADGFYHNDSWSKTPLGQRVSSAVIAAEHEKRVAMIREAIDL